MYRLIKTAILLSSLTLFGSAQAEQTPAAPAATAPSATAPSPMALRQKAQGIQQQLAQIQNDTISSNPDLKKKADSLEKLVLDTMKKQGAKPIEDGKRMDELQQQASQPGVTEEQRRKLFNEFQQIQIRMQKAQQNVMQVAEVRTAQKAFRDDLLGAMKAKNPNTEALIHDLEMVVQQLRSQQMGQR